MQFSYSFLILALSPLLFVPSLSVPTDPSFFANQLVNHFSAASSTYSQRYYEQKKYWRGPGSPIFMVMGGEGAIEPETGLFYPYINEVLASEYGAYVVEPEHRFYGESTPVSDPSNDDLKDLMTPMNALADAVYLVKDLQSRLGCGPRGSPEYCPVITVGGSYPGFLSFAMRLRYPGVIDGAYAAGAPVKFYAQQVEQNKYYDLISASAERSLAGCEGAIGKTMNSVADSLVSSSDFVSYSVERLNVCETVPEYMASDPEVFLQELTMVVAYTFANYNMANYPPDNSTDLHATCQLLVESNGTPEQKVGEILMGVAGDDAECFDFSTQLPAGAHSTVSSGDWSGVGSGNNGKMWDFQTCSLLVERIGITETFVKRDWTIEWMKDHCEERFRVTPKPSYLAEMWGFEDVATSGATRVLFTNGLNDGWSVGSITESPDEGKGLIALNFPNGAHHSDLSHSDPGPQDTQDIQEGHKEISKIIGAWLEEIIQGA